VTEAEKARSQMREGHWTGPTVYKVPGFVQCNLVILGKPNAYDFLLYCQRNPKACPLIEVTDPGDPVPHLSAPGADLRTDLPRYRVFENGKAAGDMTDIRALWNPDSVAFLFGSSLTFDHALARLGIPPSEDVWVFDTSLETVRAGRFHGPLVVTMRLMSRQQAITATQLTTRYIYTHGAPIHIGAPGEIGVDLGHPLVGRPLECIPESQIPLFWACGVTPQQAAVHSGIDHMITHAPGHGFVTDLQADRTCLP